MNSQNSKAVLKVAILNARRLACLGVLVILVLLNACGEGAVPESSPARTATPESQMSLARTPVSMPTRETTAGSDHEPASKPTTTPVSTPTQFPSPTPIPTQVSLPTLGPAGAEVMKVDLDDLLNGVTEISAPGVPGPMCVYGSQAFPVVVGAIRGVRAPVVAAGRWKSGRIVALGHDGYFTRAQLESLDTGYLVANALRWAAGEDSSTIRVGIVGAPELRTWLTEPEFEAVSVTFTSDALATVDVVVLVMRNLSVSETELLSEFVAEGGGLVTAATGWGWAQLHPHLDLVSDYAGNRLLARVGIRWANDWLERTLPEGFAVDGPPPELTHAGAALNAVNALAAGGRTLTEPEMDQALDTLRLTSQCLPADDSLLVPRLVELAEGIEGTHRWPSAERPVASTDNAARLGVEFFGLTQNLIAPESVRAHPASADFPGPVPPDAPRVTRTLTIDTAVPRWHSTGLYAAPGEVVTVTVPVVVAGSGGFHVRVGAHSDRLWHLSEWERMPEISRSFPISSTVNQVANAFGGLVYIVVPRNAGLGSIEIVIEGAVAAPLFVLGETDPAAWRDEIRYAAAPWAEIAGRNMIVTTRSSEVRNLDNPVAVAEVWDRALDLNAELAGWPSITRSSPERFVVDRQTSAGYMHSGYPIMAHLDQQANLVDVEHLRSECNWGFYHEVGHNHQVDDWTFDGTIEVTVNLFTLYVYEFLCGIPVSDDFQGSHRSKAELMALYDFDSPEFDVWTREPFLALIMYVQLQHEFGWDAYRDVFATYRTLTEAERPRSDEEKRDQWMVRFSRQVGRNLGPFFEAWGIPTSQQARDSLTDLPVWLPSNFPPGR